MAKKSCDCKKKMYGKSPAKKASKAPRKAAKAPRKRSY